MQWAKVKIKNKNLNLEQAPEDGDGQGSLMCGSPWGLKESDMNEQQNWAELLLIILSFYISPNNSSGFSFLIYINSD